MGRWLLLPVVACTLALTCTTSVAMAAEVLRMGGTGSGLALTRQLFETFRAGRADLALSMPESLGSTGAVRALDMGKLDIAILSRPLKAGEAVGSREQPLCRTPFVFYAPQALSRLALTRRDLPALYDGTASEQVRPLLRPEQDSVSLHLQQFFPELSDPLQTARQQRGRVVALTDQDAMDAAERSSSLVGAGPLTPLLAEHRALAVLPLDGVWPNVDTLASGSYPYGVTLTLAVAAQPSPAVAAFLTFLAGPEAAAIMRTAGCLPAERSEVH